MIHDVDDFACVLDRSMDFGWNEDLVEELEPYGCGDGEDYGNDAGDGEGCGNLYGRRDGNGWGDGDDYGAGSSSKIGMGFGHGT